MTLFRSSAIDDLYSVKIGVAIVLDPAFVFGFANSFGLLAWLALAVSLFVPAIRAWVWPVTQFAVPALWAVAYVLLLVQGMPETEGGGFSSIAGVRALFASDSALTAGWLHYLAFDLFVGTLDRARFDASAGSTASSSSPASASP